MNMHPVIIKNINKTIISKLDLPSITKIGTLLSWERDFYDNFYLTYAKQQVIQELIKIPVHPKKNKLSNAFTCARIEEFELK
jgi:hypothetical protein